MEPEDELFWFKNIDAPFSRFKNHVRGYRYLEFENRRQEVDLEFVLLNIEGNQVELQLDNTSIKHLWLKWSREAEDSMTEWIEKASRLSTLESLILEGNNNLSVAFPDSGKCFQALLAGGLKCLFLHKRFDDNSWEEGLVEALEKPNSLTELYVPSNTIYKNYKRLIRSSLSICSLERLELALPVSKLSLLGLCLRKSSIWDLGITVFEDLEVDGLEDLLDADVGGPEELVEESPRSLRSLRLTAIGSSFTAALCEFIHEWSNLQHFTIQYASEDATKIRDLHALAYALPNPVSSVHFIFPKDRVNWNVFFKSMLKILHRKLQGVAYFRLTVLGIGSDDKVAASQVVELLKGSRLKYLSLPKVFDESIVVDYLDRNFNCTLEALELEVWKDQVMKQTCINILRRNKIYRDGGLVNDLQVTPCKTKLFICGSPGVGKTTIVKNLMRKTYVPKCFQFSKSTYGIDLSVFKADENRKLVICDLAGQPEFHTFHHYFVRGSDKDLFLLVCKAPSRDDDPMQLEHQLKYWLRFIVAHRTLSEQKPRVLIVLNYFPGSEGRSRSFMMKQNATVRCSSVTEEYHNCIDFGVNREDNIFGLDAKEWKHVNQLKRRLKQVTFDLLEQRQKIPEFCNTLVSQLNAQSVKEKVISLEDFRSKFRTSNFSSEALATYMMHLHDMGEVICFEQDGADHQKFVVLDVPWFLKEVVGIFLPRQQRKTFIKSLPNFSELPIATVRARLLDIMLERPTAHTMRKCLIDSFIRQQLPSENHDATTNANIQLDHGVIRYLVNALQKLGVVLQNQETNTLRVLPLIRTHLQGWHSESGTSNYHYWGRRLDCADAARTLLPSGIFNMLQVNLAQRFPVCKVGEGWLHIVENRVQAILVIGGTRQEWYDRHWIDLLFQVPDETQDQLYLKQAEDLYEIFKSAIVDVCAAPNWGCPAVQIEEQVIRPQFIKNLTSSRNGEAVCSLKRLISTALEHGLLYHHTWPSMDSTPMYELLLTKERREEYFGVKWKQMNEAEQEILACYGDPSSSATHILVRKPSFLHGVGDLEHLLNKVEVKILSQIQKSELRIINHLDRLEHLVREESRILINRGEEIVSKLKLHLEFEMPKYPYITDESGILGKLSQAAFGRTLRLHFLCEHSDGVHYVEDQRGIKINFRPEWYRKAAPVLMPALRVVCFTLKVVSIAALGVAIPTPSSAFVEGVKDSGIQGVMELMFENIDAHLKSRSPTRQELEEFYITSLQLKSIDDFVKIRDLGADLKLSRQVVDGQMLWICQKHKY